MHLCIIYLHVCIQNAANKNIAMTYNTDWERIPIGGIFLRKASEFVASFQTISLKGFLK